MKCIQRNHQAGTLIFAFSCINLFNGDSTVFVQDGDDAYFSWTLFPKPIENEPVWIFHQNKSRLFSFTKDTSLISEDYIGRLEFTRYLENETLGFILRNTTVNDSGVYSSFYTAGTFFGQRLVVLEKPDKPTLSVLAQPILNGRLSLRCFQKITSHNQTMKYNWMIDKDIDKNERFFAYVDSTMIMNRMKIEDNGKTITCRSYEHQSVMSEDSDPYKINVHYGPSSVILIPDIPKYRLQTMQSLPSIKCVSSCNPDCMHTWIKNNDTSFEINASSLILEAVQFHDSGLYTCQAENYLGKHLTKYIEVTVSDIPLTPYIEEIKPPVEHKDLTLQCIDDSDNTYSLNTFSSFQWKSSRMFDEKRILRRGGYFFLAESTKADNGTIIACRGSTGNGHWSNYSSQYIIYSKYGPGKVLLTTNESVIFIDDGNINPYVSCTADCNPPCSYHWYMGNNAVDSQEGHLYLNTTYTKEFGAYVCVAYNDHGSENSTELIINKKAISQDRASIFEKLEFVIPSVGGTSFAFALVPTLVFCCHRVRKNKRRKRGKIALQAIRDKLANRQVDDRSKASSQDSSQVYVDIQESSVDESVKEGMYQSTSNSTERSMSTLNGINANETDQDQKRKREEFACKYDEVEQISLRSYEDLRNSIAKEYESVKPEHNTEDHATAFDRENPSESESNMEDDEVSTSNSEK